MSQQNRAMVSLQTASKGSSEGGGGYAAAVSGGASAVVFAAAECCCWWGAGGCRALNNKHGLLVITSICQRGCPKEEVSTFSLAYLANLGSQHSD